MGRAVVAVVGNVAVGVVVVAVVATGRFRLRLVPVGLARD